MVAMEQGRKENRISRREFVMGLAAAPALDGLEGAIPFLTGTSGQSAAHAECDVLVCGATPGGIAAAVTAARMGNSVILAEYEDHLGGVISNGLTNTDLNPAHRTAVGGFFNQFTDLVLAHYREVDAASADMPNVQACRNGFAYEPRVAEEILGRLVKQQPRLQVLLRHELKQAMLSEKRVTGAIFEERDQPGHRVRIDAKVLIDATYEGDLAAMAKVKFRLGREGRDEFNEPHAGWIYMKFGSSEPLPGSTGVGDKAIQAYCLRFIATTDPANCVPVEKPQGYNRADYHYLLQDIRGGKLTSLNQVISVYPLPAGKVEFNSKNPSPVTGLPSESLDLAQECWEWPTLAQDARKKIFERYLTHNTGLLWMLQNDPEVPEELRKDARRYGWCKDEFVSNNHLPRQLYVREGRRIEGEYWLTERDGDWTEEWERTEVQPTSIGLVEWPFDSHGCHAYDPSRPGLREGYTFVPHATCQVPYGVVVPKEVDGLLVPVACSCTHVAYNGLRMEPVFMALGEASGQAAHLALKQGIEVRRVPVDRLQQALLANNGAITYFDDLRRDDNAFIACHWLGARGLNKGYRAQPHNRLTRAEGAERLRRVLHYMRLAWPAPDGGDGPLRTADVVGWLRSAGFPAHEAQVSPALEVYHEDLVEDFGHPKAAQQEPPGITVAQFAQLVYDTIAPGQS